MVNFKFGFLRVAVKNRGVGWLQADNKIKKNKKNIKRGLLKVLGYWA